MTSQTNILNSDGDFKYSNLQELKIAQEYQDLKNMSDTVNELNKEGKNDFDNLFDTVLVAKYWLF